MDLGNRCRYLHVYLAEPDTVQTAQKSATRKILSRDARRFRAL
ncbi:MAG: hypothetical protein ACRENX_00925 [Candidatus Dormibacteria bacterium]